MPKPPTRHRAGGGAGRAARTRRRTRGTPSNPDPSAVSPAQPSPSVGQKTTTGKKSTPEAADEVLTTKAPAKRPVLYSRALAQRICAAIIEGASVRAIGDRAGMPAAGTIYKWIAHDQGARPVPGEPERRVGGFRGLYQEAKALQAELMAEEMLAIADRSRTGIKVKETKDGIFRESADMVERARLQVETRKWLLAKMLPKKWGDKVQVETSGPDGGPIKVENAPLTLPALDAVLAKIAKLAGKKDDGEGGEGGAAPVPA